MLIIKDVASRCPVPHGEVASRETDSTLHGRVIWTCIRVLRRSAAQWVRRVTRSWPNQLITNVGGWGFDGLLKFFIIIIIITRVERDDIRCLNRVQLVIVFRLRTAVSFLAYTGWNQPTQCPCGTANQTAEHPPILPNMGWHLMPHLAWSSGCS